jgi:hypothetical protein
MATAEPDVTLMKQVNTSLSYSPLCVSTIHSAFAGRKGLREGMPANARSEVIRYLELNEVSLFDSVSEARRRWVVSDKFLQELASAVAETTHLPVSLLPAKQAFSFPVLLCSV